MANVRYQNYQYETSPRKLQPEYEPKINRNKQKQNSIKKEKTTKNASESKKKLNFKFKTVFYIAVGFVVLFAICYQNSLITESFNKKEKLKAELAAIEKENEQLRVNIEKDLNLNNVEQMAKEKLGMQKLSNSQKVYISLPKKDYIESTKEIPNFEESNNLFDKILELFN